ncbi:MAG: hypothetical protein NWE92_11180 [Candidatus Bathyarchaeota archaeon]|nr:hypothetical protein [Candidatus Bathyarchaeota archaeon]
MRKKLLSYTLLVLFCFGLLFAEPVGANADWRPPVSVAPPDDIAIIFSFESPQQDDDFLNGTMNVCFSQYLVDPEGVCWIAGHGLSSVMYQGDWMQTEERCPNPSGLSPYQDKDHMNGKHYRKYNFTIDGVPMGTHKLTLRAYASGTYWDNNSSTQNQFILIQNAVVTFSVPAKASLFSITQDADSNLVPVEPSITLLTPQRTNLTSPDLVLNFTINQPVRTMAYVLDNGDSIPIEGNITLSNLGNGSHNVTVFATDEYGRTQTSGALYFSVRPISQIPIFVCIIFGVIALLTTALVIKNREKLKRRAPTTLSTEMTG